MEKDKEKIKKDLLKTIDKYFGDTTQEISAILARLRAQIEIQLK